jgi:hypothetical protein
MEGCHFEGKGQADATGLTGDIIAQLSCSRLPLGARTAFWFARQATVCVRKVAPSNPRAAAPEVGVRRERRR